MELIIQLYGIEALETYNNLVKEVPNMNDDYYIRNTIRYFSK